MAGSYWWCSDRCLLPSGAQVLSGKGYTVLDEGKIPLVIRETCRRFQVILAHRLVARKKS